MVKASKGIRCKTRKIMQKRARERGLSPITKTFRQFSEGENAAIIIDSAIHKGQPHPRFHGQTGKIAGKQGNAYLLKVNEKGKLKTVIVSPEHLKKLG